MRIAGKVVLITGASDGIGAACARTFSARGAKLALTARSEQKLAVVVGKAALVISGDLKDPEHRRNVVGRTIEHYGAIDILINNAGVGLYAPSWRAPMAEVRDMFEINFFAPLDLIRQAVPHMRARGGGMIVNVGSIGGKVTLPWLTLYSASKYALGSLTDGLRMELKGSGIHTMTVCPGYVSTGFQDHVLAGSTPEAVRRTKRFFAITPERCAEDIARGVERNARTVLSPRAGWLFVLAERLMPGIVDSRMAAIYPGRENVP